ncbi:hypothetical protein B0H14DRAFT_3755822 [Mycena olivaceomarginata]|nr:hypothetical protein B0H14DRAFT_3755822 [Mycena olivaceomarginata]
MPHKRGSGARRPLPPYKRKEAARVYHHLSSLLSLTSRPCISLHHAPHLERPLNRRQRPSPAQPALTSLAPRPSTELQAAARPTASTASPVPLSPKRHPLARLLHPPPELTSIGFSFEADTWLSGSKSSIRFPFYFLPTSTIPISLSSPYERLTRTTQKILAYPNGVGGAWAAANYSEPTVPQDVQFVSDPSRPDRHGDLLRLLHSHSLFHLSFLLSLPCLPSPHLFPPLFLKRGYEVRSAAHSPSLFIGGGFVNIIACTHVGDNYAVVAELTLTYLFLTS